MLRIKSSIVRSGFVVLGVLTSVADAAAESWTIDAVMEGLRGLQHAETTFVETRHSVFLKDPIELNGTFIFDAPQTFIKETFEPFLEKVVVDVNGVRIDQEQQREGQTRTQFIAADAHPLVEGLVDSAKATMSGEKELLEARYDLEISGSRAEWTVKLQPKEDVLRKKVESISFMGSEDLIQTVEIREADGDFSVIRLTYEIVERK